MHGSNRALFAGGIGVFEVDGACNGDLGHRGDVADGPTRGLWATTGRREGCTESDRTTEEG
jgi:hypothetical protein